MIQIDIVILIYIGNYAEIVLFSFSCTLLTSMLSYLYCFVTFFSLLIFNIDCIMFLSKMRSSQLDSLALRASEQTTMFSEQQSTMLTAQTTGQTTMQNPFEASGQMLWILLLVLSVVLTCFCIIFAIFEMKINDSEEGSPEDQQSNQRNARTELPDV